MLYYKDMPRSKFLKNIFRQDNRPGGSFEHLGLTPCPCTNLKKMPKTWEEKHQEYLYKGRQTPSNNEHHGIIGWELESIPGGGNRRKNTHRKNTRRKNTHRKNTRRKNTLRKSNNKRKSIKRKSSKKLRKSSKRLSRRRKR